MPSHGSPGKHHWCCGKALAAFLKEAAKPEWFIKTAIVLLGVKLGVMTIEATTFALDLILTGAAACFVAYMLFWPVVYAAARRSFGLRRDASAVLASGISICGVSAATATGVAIRARPVIGLGIERGLVDQNMDRRVVSMGVLSDFSKLKGLGRLALLYAGALVVVIAPIAYAAAYLFHRGLTPPLAAP